MRFQPDRRRRQIEKHSVRLVVAFYNISMCRYTKIRFESEWKHRLA